MVTEPHNFKVLSFLLNCYHTLDLKILLSLLLLSRPTISKFYEPANWNFFGLVIPLNFFWRQVETLSVLVITISNITLLVPHNISCFGCQCHTLLVVFFLSTCCWSVLIQLFCVYVSLRVLFHSCSIMKLRIALYLHICIASYSACYQAMWHNKRIHGYVLKITSCCCFFRFRGN